MRRFEELEKWLLEKATEEFNDVASHQRCNDIKDAMTELRRR